MHKVLSALQQLLKTAAQTHGGNLSSIKQVFYGDPRKIPQSSLPAITLSPSRTSYLQRGSRYDQKTYSIEVRLVYNARDFYESDTATDTSDKVFAVEDAIIKMEQTSGTTQATDRDSIAGIIESNPRLPFTENGVTTPTAELSRVVEISYAGLSSTRGFHTFEVVLTAEVTAIGDR